MRQIFSLCLLGSILFLLACNNSSTSGAANADSLAKTTTEETFDVSKARSVIEDENKKFSEEFKRGDSAALAAHYTSDAMAMPPNSEGVKKDGLTGMWGSFIRMGIKELRLSTQDVDGNSEMVTETGSYELVGDNNKSLDKGKYVVVWKNENGSWKIYRDIFNTNLPAQK